MITRTVLTAAAVALMSSTLSAQASAVRLQLAPGSQLSFDGTSTLHGFTCTTSTMQAYIDVDPSYQTASLNTIAHPIVNVQVVIPVKSLKCGGELENNMYKTLNATEFPYVIYKLTGYDLVSETATASKFSAATRGELTIAGKDNPIQMTIDATRTADGVVSATGDQAIKMTAFGIKPPRLMLGTLRVGDQLKVKFTLKAAQAAIASAMSELSSQIALATPHVTPASPDSRR
jgi:polyisoprenoid-binding protein YceI